MTEVTTANTGSFPRIGEGRDGQKLRRAFTDLDRGKITRAELLEVQKEVTVEAISLQVDTGVEMVTDGQIRWYDPVSHILGALRGVEAGQLSRFFDTNFYYRQPVIKEKVSRQNPILLDELRFAQSISRKPVKPVVTGPYTLARLCVNQAYGSFSQLIEAVSHVIAQEVAELARGGTPVIQLDEPAILQNPEDIGILHRVLEEIAQEKGRAELALYTYFGDATPIYERLQQLPVDILGFDFTYSPRLSEVISVHGSEKVLGLGLIDGRNTKMETETDIFYPLNMVLSTPGVERCFLNPSCGLEYLPKAKAVAKLENMVRLRNKFLGVSSE